MQRRHKIDAVDRLRSKIYSPKIDRKQVYLWISLWVQLTLMDWPFGIIRKIFTSLHTATIFSDPISQNRECLLVLLCNESTSKELQENHLLPNCKMCTCGEKRFFSFSLTPRFLSQSKMAKFLFEKLKNSRHVAARKPNEVFERNDGHYCM